MIKARSLRARLITTAAAALTVLCAGMLTIAQPARAAESCANNNCVPISGAGSTWSYNAIDQWQQDVNQFGMTVNYTADGSTAGRQLFAQGTTDWGASEIPYGVQDGNNTDPPPQRGYAYMPDTAGGTTFMYNLDIGNSRVTNLRLSGAVIAGIFTNKITMWNDPAIAADNPGLTLPAIKIIPVVRSDGSGATAEFTQWMLATQPAAWQAYCQAVGRTPCTQTSAYPLQPGTAMVGQPGDLGVSGYVSQAQADGAIGYVEFSYALATGFPVALVLNAAGYYTEPTPQNVAVSLLQAKINTDTSSPLYLTQDLSGVYTDPDPRTYELSSYSYMILPTDNSTKNFSTQKGYTLGYFGSYLLCQGQQQVDQLGYSAVPINLVEDGYAQLQRIPGNQVPNATSSFIQSCNNPTFSTDGTNTLADTDPQPPACDKQGPTQCTASTGGANGATANGTSGGTGATSSSPSASSKASSSSSTPGSSSSSPGSTHSGAAGSGHSPGTSGTSGSGNTPGTSGSGTTPGSTGSSGIGASSTSTCDQTTGVCTSSNGVGSSVCQTASSAPSSSSASSTPSSTCSYASNGTSGTNGTNGTNGTTGGQSANAIPVSAPTGLGHGAQIALMALAAALLVGVALVPPLVAEGSTRRRRRGPPPYNPTDSR